MPAMRVHSRMLFGKRGHVFGVFALGSDLPRSTFSLALFLIRIFCHRFQVNIQSPEFLVLIANNDTPPILPSHTRKTP